MKFTNVKVYNFEGAFTGMRNPLESWSKSDSAFGIASVDSINDIAYDIAVKWVPNDCSEELLEKKQDWLIANGILNYDENTDCGVYAFIGPNDMRLAQKLIRGGSEHRKFLRQIFVSVDIIAPIYFWKELDTYKVGTVANSTSTMHKIDSKPITIEDFEMDDFSPLVFTNENNYGDAAIDVKERFLSFIDTLELLRKKFKETGDNRYWKELIRLLPESYLQKRTITMNYENLISMYHQRKNHKLTEWKDSYMSFIKNLPYSDELILYAEDEKEN